MKDNHTHTFPNILYFEIRFYLFSSVSKVGLPDVKYNLLWTLISINWLINAFSKLINEHLSAC